MTSPISRRGLSEEQQLMVESCRRFIDTAVLPYIRKNWQREWSMTPEGRMTGSASARSACRSSTVG
jgi:hypothetical protein